MHIRIRSSVLSLLFVSLALTSPRLAAAQTSFVAFESGPVRPLALSSDGSQLFAVNTPDNRLEIFDVTAGGIAYTDSVPVGMEPVAVAVRSATEVWVVNHLSDSVSIVDLAASPPRVVRTLLVGDEPRDIVFAGSGASHAFITTAHRGQHRTDPSISGVPGAGDPQLTTEGVGRADVWVFDATSPGSTVGGTPIRILTFFADTPRALAVSPDGSTVYVAAFHSGNQTTAITEALVCNGFDAAPPCSLGGGIFAPGGVPGPSDNFASAPAPETGLIVKFDGSAWRDAVGRDWSAVVRIELPDHDVFAFDADTLAPGPIFDHVGTILFNMVVNPVTGKLYVTNIESPNHVRFEGPGNHGGSTVQGHLSETRISVLDPLGPSVDPQHLNQHIDYSKLHTDVPDLVDPNQKSHSLATPLQAIVSSDGSKIYLAAFGSARIGVFDAADIEDPAFEMNFDPTVESANYIATGGGPAGLALDETYGRLYVLTRFDNSVVSIDLSTKAALQTVGLHNPEPLSVVVGRPFLYDAVQTSGNGEASCASCHIFADFDSLAWNLGDPDASVSTNSQPAIIGGETSFHPMKGPMTTQTLRGLATHGGMHWRGDRVDGFFGTDPCTDPVNSACDEDHSFRNFIVAFEGLVGRDGILPAPDMQKFSDFTLQILLPPNPVRALDGSLTSAQDAGRIKYFIPGSDGPLSCNQCHELDAAQGFFGTQGFQSFETEPQNFKIAHLRNMYQKIGMFAGANTLGGIGVGPPLGPQVRGFGFLHDGSIGTVRDFLASSVFSLSSTEEAELEAFLLAFDTDLAPIVGQQVTLTATNAAVANPRIDLLIDRAGTPFTSLMLGGSVTECDLIVKGVVGGQERGWVLQGGGLFLDDTNTTISDSSLRALATSDGPLTYTCVPPGSGQRMGVDRDGDGALDGIDNCAITPNESQLDTDADGAGNACDADDDDDGLLDEVETNTGVFVSPLDTGTDPLLADTDGDGFSDGFEVSQGSDPTDPSSTPGGGVVPMLPPYVLGLLALALVTIGIRRLEPRG
ncbi:MAG: hypothetical protein ACE5FG_10585 [Myxococcota bacterium]